MAAMMKEGVKVHPLVIFYDSEAAYGNVYRGDIIEIAARCHPDVVKGLFQSLINTKQPLCTFATKECAISVEDLRNKPFFQDVLKKFLIWIDDMVKLAKKKHGKSFVPVLCAHHGYQFDFLILLSNMERSGIHHSILSQHNIHFADSLLFCSELKESGEKLLTQTKLSLDGLFKKFFPGKRFKGRHRAMGDVDAMVDIFTHTPLKKWLHHMKYSSTKERLEYYISQSGLKQQQAILEEKLCKLDACSKNMAIKKLLREGVTYNSLGTIFEECCSFLDFFETMKSYGIERKVAKVIALHLSGKGFENQGAKPYSKLHEEKTIADESTEDQVSDNHLVHHKNSECVQQANLAADKSRAESKSCNQGGCGEDWESEAASVCRQNFTLKCTTSTPLSLIDDDVSCTPIGKTTGKLSPKERQQKPPSRIGSKVAHPRSEATECRKSEIISKKPLGNVAEAEVRERSSRPKSKILTESREKRLGTFTKPVKSNKREPRAKRETVDLSEESTKEFIKGKKTKSNDKPKETPGDEQTKPSSSVISLNDHEALAESRRKSQGPSGDQSPPSDQDSTGKLDKESQPIVITSLDERGKQNFTRIFVGDIAILVPVHNNEACDSHANELHEVNSNKERQLEESSVADSVRSEDASPVYSESSTGAVKPVKIETAIQCESSSTCPLSPREALGTRLEDPAQDDSILHHTEVVEKDKHNSSKCEKETLLLASGSEDSHNQVEASFKAIAISATNCPEGSSEKVGVCGDDKSGNSDKTILKGSEAVFALEETNHQDETNDLSVIVDVIQVQALPVESESNHTESVTEESNGKSDPYKELEQMPPASLPADSDQPASGRFVMSEGFACQDMNTDEVDHNRRDLQAELSSDTSSTSDEFSVDTFSRQPPLGAERGFTPDAVQQHPVQTAWVESMNEEVYPLRSTAGVNYPQGSFPTYGFPYGTFYQVQQALPLLNPYFTSFGYPTQIRPMVSPQVMQPQSQIFLPPYHQYRNQMMMSSAVPQVAGFPSAAMPPSQFRPQVCQILQGPLGCTNPPVPFYGNPNQQAQESTSALLDAESAQPQSILAHVSPAPEFASPSMVLTCSQVGDEKDESDSEVSSSASKDSPFEIINLPANDSFRPLCDYSTLREESFSEQLEPDSGSLLLLTNEGSNAVQVLSSAQLSYKEMPKDNEEFLNNTTNSGCLSQSKEYSSNPPSQDNRDLVHKQITILSRDESIVAMGRRLSPDGSCMDTVGVDFVSDASFVQKVERGLEKKSACQRTLQDVSQHNADCRPSNESLKPKCPSPKPQRIKRGPSRRNKPAVPRPISGQPASAGSSDIIPASARKSVPSKTSDQHGNESSVMYGKRTKASRSPKAVRFSNERIEHDSTLSKLRASADEKTPSACSQDQKTDHEETSHEETSQTCIDKIFTKSLSTEERDTTRLLEGRSQRHTEERTLDPESKPAFAKKNSRKRINSRVRKPYAEKRPPKHPSLSLKGETDAKIDPNNNRR